MDLYSVLSAYIMALATGLLIKFGPDTIHEAMEELHKKSLTYMIGFIVLHIGGVLIADAREERGLISKIISGEAK